MTKADNNNNNQTNIDSLIREAADKLHVDLDWARSISAAEIIYLLNHAPFLQIINSEETSTQQEVKLVESKSGWTIHDYGNAISSSPGRYLYGGGYFRVYADDEDEEGGEGGGIVNPNKGTLVKQAFDTAMEMVEIAKARGWKKITIVDGHPIMERAAWIKAEKLGLEVTGFIPEKRDYQVRSLLDLPAGDFDKLRHEVRLSNA